MAQQAEVRGRRSPWVALVGVGLATFGLLAVGVVVLGRLAGSDTVAMVATGAWFGLVAIAGLVLARGRRALLGAVAGGWVVAALVVGVLVALPTLTDRTVDEEVAVGVRAEPSPTQSGAASETPTAEAAEAPAPAPVNVEVASGQFVPLAHPGTGTAAVVELAEGGRVLTLTGFGTDNGPDLRVYLTERDPAGGDIGAFVDLGALAGNQGDQQYAVPDDLDLVRYPNAVIWCRAFAVGFTSAALTGVT